MMDAAERLCDHSGLPTGRDATDTLHEYLCHVRGVGMTPGVVCPDLDTVIDDIVLCIQDLNEHINQQCESVTAVGAVPRRVAYAVSGMISGCLTTLAELASSQERSNVYNGLLRAAWLIESAWDSLLAGDIEDVRADLETEEATLFGHGETG